MSVVQSIYSDNEMRIQVNENMRTRDIISLRKSLAERRRSGITPRYRGIQEVLAFWFPINRRCVAGCLLQEAGRNEGSWNKRAY